MNVFSRAPWVRSVRRPALSTGLASVCLLAALVALPGGARGATDVYGISGNPTWNAAGSPYLLHNDVVVPSGQSLTIGEGVTVQVPAGANGGGDNRVELRVAGTLTVAGTSALPVVFTSGEAAPSPSDWYGIVFDATATGSSISHAEVRYAHRGVHVVGLAEAALSLSDLVVEACSVGLYLQGTQVDASDFVIHGGSSHGVYITGGTGTQTNTFTRCAIYDNGHSGVRVDKNGSSSVYLDLDHCTVAYNGQSGVYVYDNYSSGVVDVDLTASAIIGNNGYGFYGGYSSSSYYPDVNWTRTDVWGNTSGGWNSYVYQTRGAGSLIENPLFVDPATFDLTPTHRSPLRKSDGAGGDIGYEAYAGDLTPGHHGFYWEDATLPGGETAVAGDITVTPGVTVTIPAGATLRFAAADLMGGGESTAKGEILVLGSLVCGDDAGAPVVISGPAASTSAGAWYGIRATSATESLAVTNTVLRYGTRGLWLDQTSVVPVSLETDTCTTGVHVTGGAPALTNLTLHDGTNGLWLEGTQGDVTNLVSYGNSGAGVRVVAGSTSQTNAVTRCLVYDNGLGFDIDKNGSSSVYVDADHCTVAMNGGNAFDVYDNYSSGVVDIDVSNSVVASNTGYGFYGGYSSSSYFPDVTWTHTDVWGNRSGAYNSYTYSTAGTGSIVYNPLFADEAGFDFAPTTRSPLRYTDSAGAEMGYEAFAGDVTPGYMGWYWENFQFPSGTHVIGGDIVVTSRKIPGSGLDPVDPSDDVPPRLTIVPGTSLVMETDDAMGGGLDAARIEIVNHGILEMDGISVLYVNLTSNAAVPARGDWYGVVIAADAHATNVSEVDISYGVYGVRVDGSQHIVKNIEAYECTAGVYVDGGAPEVNSCVLHDNRYGIQLMGTAASVYDLRAFDNDDAGVYVTNASGASRTMKLDRALLYANGSYGIQVEKSGSNSIYVDLDRSTIHANDSHGIYVYDNYSTGVVDFDITYSAIVSNGGYAFYGGYSSSSYYPDISWAYTDIWNNRSGVANSYTYRTEGAGNLSYNPLFKDPANGDFTPTQRSPLRCKDATRDANSDGLPDAAGYAEYAGDPTVALAGFLNGDLTLTAAGSPYTVAGDLVAIDRCDDTPAVLTIEPGAVLRFAEKADLMGGGQWPARAEIRVADALVIDGTAAQVRLTSTAATAAPGDWGGVTVDAGATVDARGFRMEGATNGVSGNATAGDVYADGEIVDYSGWGFSFTSGSGVTIEDCLVEGGGSGGAHFEDVAGSPLVRRTLFADPGTYAVRAVDSSVDLVNDVMIGAEYGFMGRKDGSASIRFDLYNNTVFEMGADCVYTADSYSTGAMYLTARNNILSDCGGYAFNDAGSYDVSADLDYNDFFHTRNWQTGSSHNGVTKGAHSVSLDPRFEDVDPSHTVRWYDLRLLHDSPLIDLGTSTGALIPADDLLGSTRPQLAGIDMGAYEYVPPPANRDPWAAGGVDQLIPMWDEDFQDVACFDASGSSDPDDDAITYQWSFGDGQNATGVFVCHEFHDNRVHEVILLVTDEHGGIDHDVVMVDVNQRPIADPGPEVWAAAGGDAAEFDGTNSYDTDGTVTGWLWSFGDGTTSTDDAPSHVYPAGPTQDYVVTLVVTDDDGHTSAPATTIAHVIGTTDTLGPTIVHTPIADGRPGAQAVTVTATISDPSGVAEAVIRYRRTGTTTWSDAPLALVGGTTWQGTIPAAAVNAPGVDYYIRATDGYASPNTSTHPAGAPASYHDFTVTAVDDAGPTIVHTPIANGQPEGQPVTVTATVTDPSGLSSVRVFYKLSTGSTYATATMADTGNDTWVGEIPGVVVTSAGVDYYIEAVDAAPANNTATHPAGAPGNRHTFTVAVTDSDGPSIVHTPVPNGQTEGVAVQVIAQVTDPSGVQTVRLHYRTAGEPVFASVAMTANGDTRTATIPAAVVTTAGVQYYIYAQDDSPSHNVSLSPNTAPSVPHAFTVTSGDESGPSIAHTPIENGQTAGEAIVVRAGVVDSSGVASVTLYLRTQGTTTWETIALTHGAGDEWAATIPAGDVVVPGLEYYLRAVDASPNANASVSPAGAPAAPNAFTVIVPDNAGPTIVHEPVADGQQAGAAVTVTARVTDPSGVATVTLYYRTQAAGAYASTPMGLVSGDAYGASIPAGVVVAPGVEYYIVAVDASVDANQTVEPTGAPGTPHAFTVTVADEAAPVITHTPVTDGQPQGVAVAVAAHVTDASGVDEVVLYYRGLGSADAWQSAALSPSIGDNWLGAIPAAAATAPGVEYYLEAVDGAPASNAARHPATAPADVHEFTITPPDEDGPVIDHEPVGDGQLQGSAVYVAATVTDAESGVVDVTLYYRASGGAGWTSVAMTPTAGAAWSGTIPATAVQAPGVEYYIAATDGAANPNSSTHPTTAPATWHAFSVTAPDTDGPVVDHVPIEDGRPQGQAVLVLAGVTDASGVDSVLLYYRPRGEAAYAAVAMTNDGDDVYEASIPGFAVQAPAMDYYIVAEDAAAAGNQTVEPATAPAAPHTFTVTPPADATAPTIVHAPIADGRMAGDDVAIEAVVTDASGIASVSLYYRVAGGAGFTWTALSDPNGDDVWTGIIPGAAVTGAGVEYYLEATDDSDSANVALAPPTAPADPYGFTVVVPDTDAPVIAHEPVAGGQPAGVAVPIRAVVTDASPIASAAVYFRPVGGAWSGATLLSQGGGVYEGAIPAFAVTTAGVEYYLAAEDTATPSNQAFLPPTGESAPFSFTVTVSDTTGPSINHLPVADGQTEGVAIALTALVTDSSGVAGVTLRYRTSGAGAGAYATLAFGDAGGGAWSATIPAAAVVAPGVDYYITAVDDSDAANESAWPAGAPASVHTFTVVPPDEDGPTITHDPIADDQPEGEAITVEATVTDPSGVASVVLHVRATGSGTFTALALGPVGGDVYRGTIPGGFVTAAGVEYYLEAADGASPSNRTWLPEAGPGEPYAFTVAPDDATPPDIQHTPYTAAQPAAEDVAIRATVTDASGVAAVLLHYRPAGSFTFSVVGMAHQGAGVWAAAIPGFAVRAPGVEYYIEARDASAAANSATHPADAPASLHTVTVEEVDEDGPQVVHTPIGDGQLAWEAVTVTATVTDPSGVAAVTLFHTGTTGAIWNEVALVNVGGDTWSADIPGVHVGPPEVSYYLVAVDASALANETVEPVTAPGLTWAFSVTETDQAGPSLNVTPIADDRPFEREVVVEATATDASGVDAVTLFYRSDGETTFRGVPMAALGGNLYQGVIPAAAVVDPAVEYYVRAIDASPAANASTWPEDAPDTPATFTVAPPPDEDGPALAVTPVPNGRPEAQPVSVVATATDDSGIAGVVLYYRSLGGDGGATFVAAPMAADETEPDTWTATIPGEAVEPPGVAYYVVATDAAAAANEALWPATAPATPAEFTVEPAVVPDEDGPTIVHTPIADEQPAGVSVAVVATITDESDVASATLHFRRGDEGWRSGVFVPEADGVTYRATIPASVVTDAPVSYYIDATDGSPAANVSLLPTEGAAAPFQFTVFVDVEPDAGGGDDVKDDTTGGADTAGGDDAIHVPDTGGAGDASGTLDGGTTGGGGGSSGCAATATGTAPGAALPAALLFLLLAVAILRRRPRLTR